MPFPPAPPRRPRRRGGWKGIPEGPRVQFQISDLRCPVRPISDSPLSVGLTKPSSALNLHPDFLSANFHRKHFRALFFAAARPVFEPDVPSVPATDHFAFLDQPLAQREAQVRAKILDGMDFPFPLEQRNTNAISFYINSETVRHQFAQGSNPYPRVHVPDDILQALYFARPS